MEETKKTRIRLSDHFTYGRLLRFTLPSIVMMIFSSIYCVVDGYFVSNYVGKTSFASVNFTWPFIMILGSIGFMFGAGGCAVIAKTMGEGRQEKARELFSFFVLAAAICGVVIGVLGWFFIRPLCALLGAEGALLDGCVTYGRILFSSMPFFLLQYEFQSFFIAAERPQAGLYVTVASGVTNMVLDALLVAVFPLGLFGAAAATALSQVVGGFIPLIYFALPNGSALRFTKPRFDGKALLRTVTNGSSELMSNISMSIVSMLYNTRLMEYAGENGVACMLRVSFSRYSSATQPVLRRWRASASARRITASCGICSARALLLSAAPLCSCSGSVSCSPRRLLRSLSATTTG